jgi:putative ABC transport system permease protein
MKRLPSGVWYDVKHAARALGRAPRFTLTALTLILLGVGSATAIFSAAYAVLVRPLPYSDAGRLVFLAEKDGIGIAWPNFVDWRQRAASFDGLAGSLADAVLLTGGQFTRRLESRSVSSNFFHVLGTSAFRGRLFDARDARPDAAATAVVSHAFWIRELGGDPAAIGRPLSLSRQPVVIGVLPPGFRYMTPADVYLLLEPQVAANYRGMLSRGTHTGLYAVGHLKPAVTITAARTEIETIAAALAAEHPDTNRVSGVQLLPLADRVVGDMAPMLAVLSGAVTLLLLITCVNLAGLLLNRSTRRAHEFGIRAAIGASRSRLVRQLLIEQTLLVAAGGVLGAAAGAAILTGLVSVAPRDFPRLDEIRLDLAVMGWTTTLSCACAFLFGIVPVLKASGVTGRHLFIRSGRGSTRAATTLRRALMTAEIAVATVLLTGSGLMVHTMLRLARVDPGFDPRNLQTVMFSLAGPAWPDARKQVFYDAVVERLRALPGVENAAITYSLPILGSNWWNVFTIPGQTPEYWASIGEAPNAGMAPVTAGYFETMRIPLRKGRYFGPSETPDSLPVAIVNESVARKYWPNEDPIGKQIRQGIGNPYGPWRTIVGVVGDVKQEGVDREMSRQIYLPAVQQPRTTMFAVVRAARLPSTSVVEAAIHDLDRTIPVFNERSVDRVMREASSRRRIAMAVLSVFAGVAVLLAAIGLYGVIAQGVAERRREIGVRMALGATGGQIRRLFLHQGLIAAAVGIGCGVAGALAAARSLASLVFGIAATDPATLGAVAALLAGVTLLACYMPARAATLVDPSEALRSE